MPTNILFLYGRTASLQWRPPEFHKLDLPPQKIKQKLF